MMSASILLFLRLALAVSLYAFVGWALLTLWRDFRRQSELLALHQIPPVTLALLTGEEPKAYRFTRSEVVLGRDPACDCLIDDRTVSTRHARLSFHHHQWWLEDLNSTNGSFINDEAVIFPLVVTHGDRLRCGQVEFQLSIGEN